MAMQLIPAVDVLGESAARLEQGAYDRVVAEAGDPADLVRRSFAFLLEREPKESILRTFELSVIGRYFPEYEREIRTTRPR